MRFREIISDGTSRGVFFGTIHIILIIAAYLSPFWLTWKLIGVGVLILTAQFLIVGNCVLNQPQYGAEGKSGRLYESILTALGIKFNQKRLVFVLNWVVPVTVFVIALVVQLAWHLQPLVNL